MTISFLEFNATERINLEASIPNHPQTSTHFENKKGETDKASSLITVGTISTLLDSGNNSLISWLEATSSCILLLRPSTDTDTLLKVKTALYNMHVSGIIWRVHPIEPLHLWKKFLQLYFSLLDRIAATFEFDNNDRSETFTPGNFIKVLINTMPKTVDNERFIDILLKSNSIGGIPVFIESLLQKDLSLHLLKTLLTSTRTGQRYQEIIYTELVNNLDIIFGDKPLLLYAKASELFSETVAHCNLSVNFIVSSTPFAVLACILNERSFDFIMELFSELVKVWSVKSTLLILHLADQRQLARSLLVCLGFLNFGQINQNFAKINLEQKLVDGIQQRLDSSDPDFALMGRVVAECFATLTFTETKLAFGDSGKDAEDYRKVFLYSQHLNDLILEQKNSPLVLNAPISILFASDVSEEKTAEQADKDWDDYGQLEPVIKGTTPSHRASPLMNISLEDEEPRNAKIKKPKYLRDCLAYLKCPDDPTKLELALDQLTSVLDASSTLQKQELCIDLFRTILFLNGGDFKILKFDETRQALLVKLISEFPIITGPYLIKEVKEKSASLRQKLEITVSSMLAIQNASLSSFKKEAVGVEKTSFVDDVRLKSFDQQMGFTSPRKSSIITAATAPSSLQKIISNIVIPLLKSITTSTSPIFGMANGLLLEKVIYLAGLALMNGFALVEWKSLLRIFLSFLTPLLKENYQSQSRSILKAMVISLHAALSAWSEAAVSPLEFLDDLFVIANFFESNHSILMDLPQEIILIAASAQSHLQRLTDPLKLIERAATDQSAELRPIDTTRSLLNSLKL